MNRLLVLLLVLVGVPLTAAPARIQVKETPLYAQPSPLSKFLGKLALGAEVTILSEKDGWAQVKSTLGTGYIRSQAYTTKALNLKASADASGVSATEVSLAGRGFTDEIEKEYRKGHPQADFGPVDAMEGQGLDPGDLLAFLKQGGVRPQEAK